MNFYSTKDKRCVTNLEEAVMNGLAPDGGLYMPTVIPKLGNNFFKKAQGMTFQDTAFETSKKIFHADIPEKLLRQMTNNAFDFEVPIVEIDRHIYALELFHGPTLAFKDFGARFMAQLLGHFVKKSNQQITILVATSGDTGSAVAHGFLGIPGINVVILYPSKKISALQEKQLTTMGKNIAALEVKGNFDDCQRMVKTAFLDKDLVQHMKLASANSINIARLLPQSFYYIYCCTKLYKKGPIVISVPSGNFGNLTAGLIAKKMGAPIHKFIAATNRNDTVPQYLTTGKFTPKPSVATISNAMDVGNPSNFVRMLELYDHNVQKMSHDIDGFNFSDKQTKEAIRTVFKKYNYIMDPHGAVAYCGLRKHTKNLKEYTGIFLETAHPAKFFDIVEQYIDAPVPIPNRLKIYLNRKKESALITNNFLDLKDFLLSR